MKPTRMLLTLISLLIVVGCKDQGTEPQLQYAVPQRAVSLAAPEQADVINVNFSSVATGVDDGPQDGIFDSFTIPNLGSVNNNGWTSFRTAFEFSLSDVPTGSTINSATLTLVLSNYEGTRSIEVHGYAGDGTVQLSDFSLDRLVGTASAAVGYQTFVLDVTSLVADLVANGGTFAGFNVREEPANASNFLVMFLDLTRGPVLSVDFKVGPRVASAKDDCKNGGWKSVFRADGSPFKNQGDCIQYVNTGK